MSQTAQIAQGMRLGAAGALLRFPARHFVSAMLDRVIPRLHLDPDQAEGPRSSLKKTTMLILAVATLFLRRGRKGKAGKKQAPKADARPADKK